MMCLDNLRPIQRFSTIIKPDGWTCPDDVLLYDKWLSEGMPEYVAAIAISGMANKATTLISHGTTYTHRMIKILGSRHWPGDYLRHWKGIEKFCTMQNTKAAVKKPGKRGYALPSLAETYYFFTNRYLGDTLTVWDRMEATIEIYKCLK